uniref:Trans-1,2-dihydrobenzene-1,2-diol dehydrogenase n=1 Tax=Phallusia mammillata TaxID=59560 RepID=A0A6F9D5L7_9ASCI|nr:trans-1,2-dihydrobenzene-1,2-diol dehydrogenase [Phallusia mammillata]
MTDINKQYGIVLCGLGRMGKIHLKNIMGNRKLRLEYIIETDLEKANKTVTENGLNNTKVVDFVNAKQAITDDSVQGVIICTPTHTHEDLVLMTLHAGKHTLCEKPLATNLKKAAECYKLAEKQNVILLCAFNRRFDPQLRELYCRKSELGLVQSIKICSRDSPRPPIEFLRISGGIFHDCIVHDMDMARWMTGEEPEMVYSIAHCHDPEIQALDDHDSVFVVMKFPSGILAHIDVSRHCLFGYDQTVQLYGSKGNLISGNPRKSGLISDGGNVNDDIFYSFTDRYEKAYIQELVHFVELMENPNAECCIKPKDTLQASFLSQAAEDSWKEKRTIDVNKHRNLILGELAEHHLFK